jgi:uncharacterized membrane protein YgcG
MVAKMKNMARLFLAAAFLVAIPFALADDVPTPAAGHRVVDQSHVLTGAEATQLADKLKALESRTGAQVAVLTVPSAGPEGIAPFANRVFVGWKLGRKDVDDGVLVVLATQDRRVRIEVGRGLEGDITDVAAKRITADRMAPWLAKQKYALGLNAGVDAIAEIIDNAKGTPNAGPPPPPENIGVPSWQLNGSRPIWIALAAVLALVALIGVVFRSRRRTYDPVSGGGSSQSWSGSSSSSFASDSGGSSSNDSGGGDSAGGGSDSSY